MKTLLVLAALVFPASASAYVALVDEPPAEQPAIVERVGPIVATGATVSSDESIRSDGADDTKVYFRCDENVVYAVPRERAVEFAAGMAALGYICETVDIPPEPTADVADPATFDANGDRTILWRCDTDWVWLVAPFDIFQTDPELVAGLTCVPVGDA